MVQLTETEAAATAKDWAGAKFEKYGHYEKTHCLAQARPRTAAEAS